MSSASGSMLRGSLITAVRENVAELQRNRGWILALGVALILIGTLALAFSFSATLATMFYLGYFLVIGGIIEIAGSFWARHWGGFFLGLLMGILLFIAGIITINHPGDVSILLTLILSLLFMTGGLVRILTAVMLRFSNWGWVVLSGIVTFALGFMIWRQWPISGLWVPGTLVGIDLIFSGWSYVALASWLRRVKVS